MIFMLSSCLCFSSCSLHVHVCLHALKCRLDLCPHLSFMLIYVFSDNRLINVQVLFTEKDKTT